MSDSLTNDYSTSENTPENESAWQSAAKIVDDLTRQRDRLAKSVRKHEAGQGDNLDPLRELQAVHDGIRKAMALPDLVRVAPADSALADPLVRDLIAGYWQQVAIRKNTAATGFTGLNNILSGGFEPGRLVCVLGAPNTGKTTFVHQVADHIASAGRPVLYVTSEDVPSALFAKTLARIGGIPYTAVLKGWDSFKPQIDQALAEQLDRQSTDRLRYLDATNGVTLDVIQNKAEAHFKQYEAAGPGVIVVDYLQRLARAIKTMGGMSQDLREVVTMVAERLRALACEMGCTVVAITAQNRANYARGAGANAMASAKESGDIEYTCDVLMALAEDSESKRALPPGMTAITLYVDKNRQGQRGRSVAFDFWPERQQFTEVEV